MARRESSAALKLGFGIVTGVFIVALVVLMSGEQSARSASQSAHSTLEQIIMAGGAMPTDQEVHEKLGREPDITRIPAKHRLVEEYRWSGSYSTYTVYVYYMTAATKLLTAVSLNTTMSDLERPDE